MDIHYRQRNIENGLSRLKRRTDVTEKNKETIKRFTDYNFARGLSPARVDKYLTALPVLATQIGKDFELAGKDDIQRVVGQIERTQLSPWTKRDYRSALKYFYRWLRDTEEFPPEVRWLKTTAKATAKKLPSDLLTPDEVIKLINTADSPRDRAFIATLYESGCRVGELGGLRVKDIQFDKYGAILTVDGKTGMRRVRVVAAAPFLASWLSFHPQRQDREAFVWITVDKRELMGYRGITNLMRRVTERTGIKKKTNCHSFRHSRASYLANFLSSAQMNEHFGWTQGSKMAAVYIHLSGRAVDSALLNTYGIKMDEDNQTETLQPKVCGQCSAWNPFTSEFCERCHQLLATDEIRTEEKPA
ncbi:MAG: hypothetical protein HW389_751 [Bacteroidetes bacterium]|nr:hypothetical protein [Bacteroidota bacterium]